MGLDRVMALRHTPATCRGRNEANAVATARRSEGYISIVLRIRPTARPSISKGSPGCTTMVG